MIDSKLGSIRFRPCPGSLVFLFLLFVAAVPSIAVVGEVNYQALLLDDLGDPVTGTVNLSFSLWDQAENGIELWTEDHLDVDVLDGVYSVSLGETVALTPNLLAGPSLYLEVTVENETLVPRQRLLAVPYAIRTSLAESVTDGSIMASSLGEPCNVDEVLIQTDSGWTCQPLPQGIEGDILEYPAIETGDVQMETHTISAEVNGVETPWFERWGCDESGFDQSDCVYGYGYNLSDIDGSRVNGWTYGMRNAKEQSFIDPITTQHIMFAEENSSIQYPAVSFVAQNVGGGSFTPGNYLVLGNDLTDVTHGSAYIESVNGSSLELLWQQRDGIDAFAGETITEVVSLTDPVGTATGVVAEFPDPTTVSFPFNIHRYFAWVAAMDRSLMTWEYLPSPGRHALRFGKFSNGFHGVTIGTSDQLPVDNGLLVGGRTRLNDDLEFRATDAKRIAIKRPANGLVTNRFIHLPRTSNGSILVTRQASPTHGISIGAISNGGTNSSGNQVCEALDEDSSCLFVLEFSTEDSPTVASCGASHSQSVKFLATCN